MSLRHPLIPRRPDAVAKHRHADAPPVAPRPHPLIELQRRVGNQAVLRLVRRRPTAQAAPAGTSGPSTSRIDRDAVEAQNEHGERVIRDLLKKVDKLITQSFDNLESALPPPERDQKLPLIQFYKTTYLSMGILTQEMINNLERVIFTIRFPKKSPYMEMAMWQFAHLRKGVRARDSLLEGLQDPGHWWVLHGTDDIYSTLH